jgi:hypothetical protein
VGVINNLRSSDSTERNSAVQFETNAIYGFVPSSISSPEETNAGLQGTAIYFDLKDSL